MALISINYVFSAGAVIVASQHNANNSTIVNAINGSLDNTNLTGSAGITYANLTLTGQVVNADIASSAAIVANKLDLTSPGSIGTTAPGSIKSTTLEATTTFKLGTTNQGDILYDNGTSLVRLTPGTSGYYLKTQGAGANPVWAAASPKMILTSLATYASAATNYDCPGGGGTANATQANRAMVIPLAGTIKNLYVATTSTANSTLVFTVYKNTSAQTLTCTVGSTLTSANDTTHSFSVVAGDTISFECISTRSGTALTSVSVELDPT